MKLKFPFANETRWLFFDTQYSCWECDGNGQENGGTELHHITGRTSDSPLNACVLCKKCHDKIGHSKEEESKYLIKTIKLLVRIKYIFTSKDIEFYKKHNDKY